LEKTKEKVNEKKEKLGNLKKKVILEKMFLEKKQKKEKKEKLEKKKGLRITVDYCCNP